MSMTGYIVIIVETSKLLKFVLIRNFEKIKSIKKKKLKLNI